MRSYLTPEGQQKADTYAIEHIGLPGALLMENAASGSAHCIAMWLEASTILKERPIIMILCGSGNNGGDGFAIARHLHCMNRYTIRIIHFGDIERMSQETRANYDVALALDIPCMTISEEHISNIPFDADCIIDAMLGTGSTHEVYGVPFKVLQLLHEQQVYDKSLCIAIDIPSGINAESGEAHEFAFKAHGTCTMFSEKVGMQLYPAKKYCGDVEIIMLGVPESIARKHASVFALEEKDITSMMGVRSNQSHKYNYGRVLIIAGSMDMSGAPVLCASAAFRTGVGLVEALTPIIHPAMPPETLISLMPMDEDGGMNTESIVEKVKESLSKTDAIVCGPGLGQRAGSEILNALLDLQISIPVILDADAIPATSITLPSHWIITPHAGECSRMTGLSREQIESFPLTFAREVSQSMKCILHVKSVPACTTNGETVFLTNKGNPGMATAGTGDVLSGMIGALLARGLNSLEACALAAMLHAQAGDFAASVFGMESMSASDIIASIPHILDQTLMDAWEDQE